MRVSELIKDVVFIVGSSTCFTHVSSRGLQVHSLFFFETNAQYWFSPACHRYVYCSLFCHIFLI